MASCNNTTLSSSNITDKGCKDELNFIDGFPGPAIPSILKDLTRAVYICTFFLGVIGNVLVSFIIVRKPKPRKGIHIFTLNLSISDLVVLIVYLPLQMKLFESDMVWSLGDVFCKISYLIIPLSIYASVGTLIAITWDRYMAIVHPLTNIKQGRTKKAIFIIWLTSFVMTMPLLLVSGVDFGFCVEANWPNEKLERAYWILMFLVQCVFPTMFFAVAYTVIIINLKQRSLPLEKSEYAKIRLLARKRQHKGIIKLAVALILVYIICVLPQHIVFFWVFYGNLLQKSYSMYVFLMANLMSIVNSAINPIIYGTLNKEIKKGLSLLFRCQCISQNSDDQIASRRRGGRKCLYEKSGSLLSTRLLFSSAKEASKLRRNPPNENINKQNSHINNNSKVQILIGKEAEMDKIDDIKNEYFDTNQQLLSTPSKSSDEYSAFDEAEASGEMEGNEFEVTGLTESNSHQNIVTNHIICRTTRTPGQFIFPKVANRFKRKGNLQNGNKKRVTFSNKEDRVTFIPLQTFVQANNSEDSSALLSDHNSQKMPKRNGSLRVKVKQ